MKDLGHFIDVQSQKYMSSSDEVCVSFAASSPFTLVHPPTHEVVEVIHDMLRKDATLEERTPLLPDRIAELLETCLRSTYFSYRENFYELKKGATMGKEPL